MNEQILRDTLGWNGTPGHGVLSQMLKLKCGGNSAFLDATMAHYAYCVVYLNMIMVAEISTSKSLSSYHSSPNIVLFILYLYGLVGIAA